MGDPLGFLRDAEVVALTAILLGATLTCGALFPRLRPGIVAFELAWRPARAKAIAAAWEASGQTARARGSLRLDTVFVVLYALTLLAAGALAGRAARAETAGAILGYAGLLAGVLDLLENRALGRMLAGHHSVARTAALLATAKFALVIGVVVCVVFALPSRLVAGLG